MVLKVYMVYTNQSGYKTVLGTKNSLKVFEVDKYIPIKFFLLMCHKQAHLRLSLNIKKL